MIWDKVLIAGAVFAAGFGAGYWVMAPRVDAANLKAASWKNAAEQATKLAAREAERREALASDVRKRLERINSEPVAVKTRIQNRYVYLPDNASCVVRLQPASDEPATVAGDRDSGNAAVLDVSKAAQAYERARKRLNALDGAEGRIRVVPN